MIRSRSSPKLLKSSMRMLMTKMSTWKRLSSLGAARHRRRDWKEMGEHLKKQEGSSTKWSRCSIWIWHVWAIAEGCDQLRQIGVPELWQSVGYGSIYQPWVQEETRRQMVLQRRHERRIQLHDLPQILLYLLLPWCVQDRTLRQVTPTEK